MFNPKIDLRTSCTRDEAISIMLGFGHVRFTPPNEDATPEEIEIFNSLTFSIKEYLHDEYELLEGEYIEAKSDHLSEEIIAEKLAAFDQLKALIKKAALYSRLFDDEVAKGKSSALRIHDTTEGETHYTLNSLHQWMRDMNDGDFSITQESPGLLPEDTSPWLIANPNDPPASQPWYTAARYFARQLVKDDSTLLTKRDVLASKVVKLLTGAGIYKRGGKKPFDPGTIKKALSNVVLG